MDLNKVGLLIGVLALILAVPLAVLANMLTPHVTAWWGTTSERRARKRVAELQRRLSELEGEWAFSSAEWETYRLVARTAIALLGLAYIFFGSLVFVLYNPLRLPSRLVNELAAVPPRLANSLAPVLVPVLAIAVVLLATTTRNVRTIRDAHSPRAREQMKKELDELSARLGENGAFGHLRRQAELATKMHEKKDQPPSP